MKDLINHVAFVVDRSGSMSGLSQNVIDLFDQQVQSLAKQSLAAGQETRVTVYLFGSTSECVIFDKDVLRLPSLKDLYNIEGMTALVDCTILSINDLKRTAQMYGDHAFLVYVLTDGRENDSHHSPQEMKNLINSLPDNWTLATFVPNDVCAKYATKFGFPDTNVVIWETSAKGVKAVYDLMERTHKTFFAGRATGKRKFDGAFKLDLTDVKARDVSDNLVPLGSSKIYTLRVSNRYPCEIRNFVEAAGLIYNKGCAFYQLTKPEVVQEYKEVIVRNRISQRCYGGPDARAVLGIPENTRIKLTPEMLGKFDVFIQSTSVNRKLVPGTDLIVMR